MKKRFGLILLVLSLISLFALVSCSDNEPSDETSLVLDRSSLSMTVGDTYVLSANIVPTPAADAAPAILWKSSDESIVSCQDGKVTAKAPGKTTVIASVAAGPYAVCAVEVTGEAETLYVVEGERVDLDTSMVDIHYENGEYISFDTEIARVEHSDGVVTVEAVSLGKTQISIISGENSLAYRRIIVLPKENSGVLIDYAELPISVSYNNGRCTTTAEIYEIIVERDNSREYLDAGKVMVTLTLKFRKLSDSEGADAENPAVFGFELYSKEVEKSQFSDRISTGFCKADGTEKVYTCALLALLDVGDGERNFTVMITDLSTGGN